MKETFIEKYWKRVGYDWHKDANKLRVICGLTKSRSNKGWLGTLKKALGKFGLKIGSVPRTITFDDYEFTAGMEQPFFIKSVVESCKAKSFFEIGTGRGTAAYAVSLIPRVSTVVTVDVIPHAKKQWGAIAGQGMYLSNKDLYEAIPFAEKRKIEFKMSNDYPEIIKKYSGKMDVCFIDGNHDDFEVVMNDFRICFNLLKKTGIIVWDDYDPNKFVVKDVVDTIIEMYGYQCELVSFRGHIFKGKREKGAGEVIMKIKR